MFIDASKLYEKEKKQNVMKKEHIDKVLELYNNRKTVEKISYLVSFEDIKANDYNLNIPRYVDTSEEEEEMDLRQLSENIKETSRAIKAGNDTLLEMFGELTFADSKTKDAVEAFINVFKDG